MHSDPNSGELLVIKAILANGLGDMYQLVHPAMPLAPFGCVIFTPARPEGFFEWLILPELREHFTIDEEGLIDMIQELRKQEPLPTLH